MEDEKVIEEAVKICYEYTLLQKSRGTPLISVWLIQKDEFHLLPSGIQSSTVTFNDIRTVGLLEHKSIISLLPLPIEGKFLRDIDYKDFNYDNTFPTVPSYIYNRLEAKEIISFPHSLKLVFFLEDAVNKFLELDIPHKICQYRGCWIDKQKGEYQFSNKKTHSEKGKVKKKIFIEMMDLYNDTGIIRTQDLASRTGKDVARIRIEINQISDKLVVNTGYEIFSKCRGYYEIRKLTG